MVVNQVELRILAEEEMGLARRLSWNELKRVTPWSDAFNAFSASGYEIEVERNYIWREEGRSILVEVRVRPLHARDVEIVETAEVTPKGFA